MNADQPPARLPHGPHGLSRTEVKDSQRTRMIAAMIDAVAEKGYLSTTVSDVLSGAGVSRATFYEQFTDKADCFRATYDSVIDLLAQVMAAGIESLDERTDSDQPIDRIDAMVGWYLDLLSQSANLAKVFLVEVYAAGPELTARRRRTIDTFVDLIFDMVHDQESEADDDERRFTIRALVTALVALVTEAAAAGEIESVTELRAPFRKLVTRVVDAPDH